VVYLEDDYWVLEKVGEGSLCDDVLNASGSHSVALCDGVGEGGVVLCDRVYSGHV
jgi:hypothetical protein